VQWSRQRWLLTLLVSAPLLGLFGVVGAELVPDGRIAAHLVEALDRGELDARDRTISMLGTTADHYAECTAVTIGLGDPTGNIVRRALFSPAAFGCVPAVDELSEFAATGVLTRQPDYMRYWHGYTVFTRPALALFGLSGTRWLAIAILGGAVAGFTRSAGRRFGRIPAALVLVPALLTTDMIVGGWSISQALGMATAWFAGWLVLVQTSRDATWPTAALAAAIGGAINAYFDLMVAIPASLILCTVAAGLTASTRDNRFALRPAVAAMGASAGGWLAGLGGMWFAKWLLAWLLVDRRRIVDSVRDQVEFRTGGDYEGVTGTRLTGFTKNVQYWWDQPLAPLVLLGVAVAVGYAVWRHTRRPAWRWQSIGEVAACCALAAVPFALWYVVLNNHNQIHVWQTYRSVAVAIGAIAAFAYVAVGKESPRPLPAFVATLVGIGDDEAVTSDPSQETGR
jgi:hypothetical protein